MMSYYVYIVHILSWNSLYMHRKLIYDTDSLVSVSLSLKKANITYLKKSWIDERFLHTVHIIPRHQKYMNETLAFHQSNKTSTREYFWIWRTKQDKCGFVFHYNHSLNFIFLHYRGFFFKFYWFPYLRIDREIQINTKACSRYFFLITNVFFIMKNVQNFFLVLDHNYYQYYSFFSEFVLKFWQLYSLNGKKTL